MKKRILSLLLTLCMVVSVLPTAVFAADEKTSSGTENSSQATLNLGEDLYHVTSENDFSANKDNAEITVNEDGWFAVSSTSNLTSQYVNFWRNPIDGIKPGKRYMIHFQVKDYRLSCTEGNADEASSTVMYFTSPRSKSQFEPSPAISGTLSNANNSLDIIRVVTAADIGDQTAKCAFRSFVSLPTEFSGYSCSMKVKATVKEIKDDNLYSFDLTKSGTGVKINENGQIEIDAKNENGTDAELYHNFFASMSDKIVTGEYYRVSYTIETETGAANVYISSTDSGSFPSQLGNKDYLESITGPGTVTGSFIALADDANANNMLRSYAVVSKGKSFKAKISINVTKLDSYEITVSNGITATRADFTQPVSTKAPAGHEVKYQISVGDDANAVLSVKKTNSGDPVDHTYTNGMLSFTMPAEPVTISAQTFQLRAQVDDCDIKLQSVGQKFYLFLPASADFTKLKLAGNATLKNEAGDKEIALSNTAADVNLTTLFGANMEAGKEYTADVYSGNAKVTTVTFMQASKIPTMYITSDQTVAQLNASKSNVGKGSITLANADGTKVAYNSALASIKGRGNTSWSSSGDKRPYNIKLAKTAKAELIDGAGPATKWCLISDNCQGDWVHEAAGLANMAAYDMYEAIDGANAMAHETINLYINGEYRGVYMLTEKVEINKERVNVTESNYSTKGEGTPTRIVKKTGDVSPYPQNWGSVSTASAAEDNEDPAIKAGIQAYQYSTGAVLEGNSGGFLLELDRGFNGEASWFVTKHGYPYVLKEPEFATKEQVQMIAQYVQKLEDAVYAENGCAADGTYYADLIDLDSLAKKIIIDMVSAQCDTFVTSCFFSIDTNDEGQLVGNKLIAGPAWDYDGSNYGSTVMPAIYKESDSTTGPNGGIYSEGLVGRFYLHGDFAAKMAELSDGAMKTAWDNEKVKVSEYVTNYADSYAMNSVLWNSNDTNKRPGDLATFQTKFSARYDLWYNTLYSKDRLLGVTAGAAEAPNTLKATVNGAAATYQWYKLNENGTLASIADANTDTFKPDENGTYYCKVTGTSIGGLNVTTMTSNPVEFSVTNVNVTFNADNGTEASVVSVKAGDAVTQSKNPEKTGYNFDSWYLNDEEYDFGTPVTENITLTAKWTPVTYTITYDLDGGTNNKSNPNSYTVEDDVTLKDPTREGYTFTGWTGTDLTEATKEVTLNGVTGDKTFTANWTINSYTAKWTGIATDIEETYKYGNTITKPADPTKAGYTFKGWYGYTENMTMPADNVTFTAHWERNTLTLTPNKTEAVGEFKVILTVGEAAGDITVTCDDETITVIKNDDGTYTAVLPNPDEEKTYTFTAVDADDNSKATCTVKLTHDATNDEYNISASSGVTPSVEKSKSGETVTFTVAEKTGYTAAVTVKDADSAAVEATEKDGTYSFTMPAKTVSIVATYTPITYTITYDLDGGTNAKANPDSYTVEQTVTLAEPTREGYIFTGWTWDGQTEAAKTAVIAKGTTGNKTFKANWKEEEKTPTITDFTDVKSGDWFYDSVKWALDQKITNGTSETTYSPAQGCTRAQIVTFLWRAFGEPEPTTTENPFTDVTQDENHKCYYKAILWAAEKGITTGTTETTFSPNEYCTRAQIVTFLYRAAGKPEPKGGKMPFEDVKQGDYYYNAVLWACENGIAKGMTATTFEPDTTCTRAQSVTFVYRAEDFLG